MRVIPTRVIATCFALVSFAAAILVGIWAENPATTILGRALLVMLTCWVIGLGVGSVMMRSIDEHIARYKQQHPMPDDQPSAAPGAADEFSPGGQGQEPQRA